MDKEVVYLTGDVYGVGKRRASPSMPQSLTWYLPVSIS